MSAETAEVKAVTTDNAQTFGTSRLAPGMYTLSRFGGPLAALAFKMDGRECCFGEVYEKLHDSKIKEMPESHHPDEADKYVTEAGEVYVTGGQIELWLLRDLLELARNGIDPFGAMWFPYDFDVSREADVVHTFFVLCSGKIVDERFSFTSEHPLVLERHENPRLKDLASRPMLGQRVCVLLVPQVLYRDDGRAAHGAATRRTTTLLLPGRPLEGW